MNLVNLMTEVFDAYQGAVEKYGADKLTVAIFPETLLVFINELSDTQIIEALNNMTYQQIELSSS